MFYPAMFLYYSILVINLLFGHPLHVTITSIDMDHATREVTVSHKFYIDDFSLLFYHLYERNIKPLEGNEFSESELQIIELYLADAFQIEAEKDTPVSLEFVKKDQNKDSIWLYFKGELPEMGDESFSLTNRIMLDLYNDQTNLVIIASEGKEQGFAFDNNNRQVLVEFGIGN